MVPSGASTGKREAVELRDGDDSATAARACASAVQNVNETIAPEIEGMEASEQAAVDQALLELDGTPEQVGARRQRASSACRWPSPAPRADDCRAAALPVPRRRRRARSAGAA